ncbi:Lactonase, 7-bladed beta-propeller [Geoglobus ahangari]|uniref:Lactonase, 7-bladed beta-propeller n=1 Tax=Geoglobus ahangari TaxID=113653 RepID=A0A0F7IE81_9EURY|nr:Lactonase, 7-bladed beta-propeller [Geoglobus ahangari]
MFLRKTYRKRHGALIVAAICALAFSGILGASASEWAVVANSDNATISTINLSASPSAVHGPFLQGQLGVQDGVLDVVITPDSRRAVVSNFYSNEIYVVNITDPTSPVVEGSVSIPFSPEDLAITSDGKYVLVTDGLSALEMAVVDLNAMTLNATYSLQNDYMNAIAIAPDNTVIIVSYLTDKIIYGMFDPNVGIASVNTMQTEDGPVNVEISPDGKTVLVANYESGGNMSVYAITAPGTLAPGVTPLVTGLPNGIQSIAFSPDGTKAYVVSTADSADDVLSWVQINSVGDVSLGGSGVATLLSNVDDGYFGVDVVALTSDGSVAVVGNPGEGFAMSPSKNVTMVDLSTWVTSSINTNEAYPSGIKTFTQAKTTPPLSSIPEFESIAVPLLGVIGVILVAGLRRDG